MTVTTDSTVPLMCDQARVNVTPLAATRRSTFGDVARAWPLIEKKSLRADSRNTSTTFGPSLLPGAALGPRHPPRPRTPSTRSDAIAHRRGASDAGDGQSHSGRLSVACERLGGDQCVEPDEHDDANEPCTWADAGAMIRRGGGSRRGHEASVTCRASTRSSGRCPERGDRDIRLSLHAPRSWPAADHVHRRSCLSRRRHLDIGGAPNDSSATHRPGTDDQSRRERGNGHERDTAVERAWSV